jgi:hypothetical protein
LIVLLIAGFSAGCPEEEQQVPNIGEFYNASRYEEANECYHKVEELLSQAK